MTQKQLIKNICLFFFMLISYSAISSQNNQDTLRFGLIKYKSLKDFTNTYKPFVEYISAKCNKIASFQIVDDTELGYLLNNNKIDIGIFKPFPYLKAKADFPNIEVFASHYSHNSKNYAGVIMVRRDDTIKSLQDLRDKKMLFVKPTSTSGYRIPKGILREHNIDIDSSLLSYKFSGSHDSSLKSLVRGDVDAIAIDKIALANNNSDIDLNTLLILEEFEVPHNSYVFSPYLDNSTRNEITDIMTEAHKDPQTLEGIFKNELNINQWYRCTDENYNQLRRYLRIVRNKPTIKLKINIKESAKKVLKSEGDILSAFFDDLVDELANTKRFTVLDSASKLETNIDIYIDVSLINKKKNIFKFKIRKNGTSIGKVNINISEIASRLSQRLTNTILVNTPIKSQLFKNSDGWFIIYGLSDGINISSYNFIIKTKGEDDLILNKENINKATPLNIYFYDNSHFKKNTEITIQYIPTDEETISNDGSGIFDIFRNWDLNWDFIGIIGGVIIALVGVYFTFRKKQRFRNMLYQTNDLLKNYIEGKYKIDNQVIEQKERVNRSLELGRINENQFLILKHRIDEIEAIVDNQLSDFKDVSPDIEKEIEKILKDGIITEKEYSKLLRILKNKKKH